MAKVSNIIFCLNATNEEGVGVSASNILSVINPEYVPGLFTFSVVITLLDIDVTIQHSFTIDFWGPSKENVVHIDGMVPALEDDSNLPSEYKGVNIAMDWNNVNFKTSGIYTIQIGVDDVTIGEKDIYVRGKNE